MSDIKFDPGDIVRLKSGGPDMTVSIIDEDNNSVKCKWYLGPGQGYAFGWFNPNALEGGSSEDINGDNIDDLDLSHLEDDEVSD